MRRDAANWLSRRQGGRDPDIEAKFRRWYDAAPSHAAAFDSVARSYEQAGLLRYSPAARPSGPAPAISMHRSKPAIAVAAAAAILVLVPTGVALLRESSFLNGTEAVMLMTNIGEIKEVRLQDGSKVTLDTSTKLEVKIGRSKRSARLKYGRARFQIARGAAPFIVETEETRVTAAQGMIDVETIPGRGRVDVIAGAADVGESDSRPPAIVALRAGESVSVGSGGAAGQVVERAPADWTRGMLQFDGTPLAEAVALANRYSERKITLVSDIGALKVTGAFRAGDTAGLAKALAAAFDLSAAQRLDGAITLSPKAARLRKKKGG